MTKHTRAFAYSPAVAPDSRKISGLAAAFYDPADPRTVYRFQMQRPGDKSPIDVEERILTGAFDKAVAADEVMCLYNHAEILGRRVPGNLKNNLSLAISARGLEYDCDPPVDHVCDRVVGLIRSEIVTGSSFQFSIREGGVKYRQEPGSKYLIRELTDLRLHDVAPVDDPAFKAATVGLRTESRTAEEDQQITELLAPVLEVDQRQWDADRATALWLRLKLGESE